MQHFFKNNRHKILLHRHGMTLPFPILHQNPSLKNYKTSKRAEVKNSKMHSQRRKLQEHGWWSCKGSFPRHSQQRNVARKLLLLRMCEYNRIHQSCMTSTTTYNIPENKRNVVSYNICLVKKFDCDHNFIQEDTTRYNKVAKRVQHFIKHQSCMMLYEMLYSFDRGFRFFVEVDIFTRNTFFF